MDGDDDAAFAGAAELASAAAQWWLHRLPRAQRLIPATAHNGSANDPADLGPHFRPYIQQALHPQ